MKKGIVIALVIFGCSMLAESAKADHFYYHQSYVNGPWGLKMGPVSSNYIGIMYWYASGYQDWSHTQLINPMVK